MLEVYAAVEVQLAPCTCSITTPPESKKVDLNMPNGFSVQRCMMLIG